MYRGRLIPASRGREPAGRKKRLTSRWRKPAVLFRPLWTHSKRSHTPGRTRKDGSHAGLVAQSVLVRYTLGTWPSEHGRPEGPQRGPTRKSQPPERRQARKPPTQSRTRQRQPQPPRPPQPPHRVAVHRRWSIPVWSGAETVWNNWPTCRTNVWIWSTSTRRSTATATTRSSGARPRRSGPSRIGTRARRRTSSTCGRDAWNWPACSEIRSPSTIAEALAILFQVLVIFSSPSTRARSSVAR
jgi:hypothetical protein